MLKGGILIIGSLLWDNAERQEWRNNHLICKDKIPVPIPIRYGRISTSRHNTYTMVYSNECCSKNKVGKGWVIPIRAKIDMFIDLKSEASALGKAEGFSSPQHLFSNWGSVALLLNPKKQ
jgi:hypothetical protein